MTSLANALDPSSRAASAVGPKQGMPARAYGVGDAGDERRLGADHDQPDAELGGQRGDRGAVHRVDVVERRHARPCRGCRGGVHRGRRRGRGQGEDQRVLAPAGPDHEDVHAGHPS